MQIQKDLIHIERQSECLSLLSQDDCLSPQDHSQGDVLLQFACTHDMLLHLTNL